MTEPMQEEKIVDEFGTPKDGGQDIPNEPTFETSRLRPRIPFAPVAAAVGTAR